MSERESEREFEQGRIGVRKTYKLFIAGAFPRSESGRSYAVMGAKGDVLAHAALGSRKDVRDAVVAARAAHSRWSTASGYNRGQVLYRVAEMLEDRAAQFVEVIVASEGASTGEAVAQVGKAVDRWVWYAGWCDKLAQLAGSVNPVSGPYLSFSTPEPCGVVGVVAPQASSLLGLVSVLAPVIASGNSAVLIASGSRPLAAVTLGEVLATSDLPGGVANIVTGPVTELAGVLADHRDVDGLDLCGLPPVDAADVEARAAAHVARVVPPPAAEPDWWLDATPRRMMSFIEIKTVWHPVGR